MREAGPFFPLNCNWTWRMFTKGVERGHSVSPSPPQAPLPPSQLTLSCVVWAPHELQSMKMKSPADRAHARISQSTWLWYLFAGLWSHSSSFFFFSFVTEPRVSCWVLLSTWNPESREESFILKPRPRSDLETCPNICCPLVYVLTNIH